MRSATGLAGLLVTTWLAGAAEFPLELKNVTVEQAMRLPGGYGAYGQLSTTKPVVLKAEPKAISAHPIYGQLQSPSGTPGMLFRVDESKGDGQGYDVLIVDLNGNFDLTDDPIAERAQESNPMQPAGYEHGFFGPIQAARDQAVGIWRPAYAAEFYIYNRQMMRTGNYFGNLRLRPACYLEASVDLGGVREKVGLLDANCNLKLGDPAKPQVYRGPEGENWYFQPGDCFLRDRDGNGKFEADQFDSEASQFCRLLYFGGKPYSVNLSADLKALQLESYSGGLGELALGPKGQQVRALTLAREVASGQWEAFNPEVVAGKIAVPVGNYRLYSCIVAAKNDQGELTRAGGYLRVYKEAAIRVEAGKTAALKCGPPLTLEVTATRQQGGQAGGGLLAAAARLFSGRSAGPPELRINMLVTGAGGETYSGYVQGKGMAPKPTFTITAQDGKQIASGNLEFG